MPQTPSPKPQTLDPKPQTPNPKPQTPDPEPWTLERQHYTRNQVDALKRASQLSTALPSSYLTQRINEIV